MNTPEQVNPNSSGLPVLAATTPLHDSVVVVGSELGKYRIVRKLGEGGMGVVFEAEHVEIGQRAAIKVLHPHLLQQPKFVKRFVDEARLISMVGHPGLVKIYDFIKSPSGAQCIVMEFLVGESLWSRFTRMRDKARAEGGPPGMPVNDVLQIGRQVASALAAVHGRGITHRDLKPDNIMLVQDSDTPSGERAKILDFGIARLDDSSGERQTTTGVSLGTPTYMAPEQIEGVLQPTERIDVYALGIILFELLSGEAPFQSATTGGVLRQHLIKPPPPLPSHVPAELQALVRAALEKDPTARPNMAQIVERFDALRGSGRWSSAALHVVPPLSQEVPTATAQRLPRIVYVGALAVVVVALAVLIMLLMRRPPTPAPVVPPPVTQVATPTPPATAPASDAATKTSAPTVEKQPNPAPGRAEPAPVKKSTPRGESKPRPSKGMRFGDLPRTSKK